MSAEDHPPIPSPVLEVLGQCRDLGTIPMTDVRMVLRWLRDEGRYVVAEWVEKNESAYLAAMQTPTAVD
tara:strand:- start:153 stop:359 length:207 start_codon:yes stop_codon:yes gene_type:complete